MSEYSVAVGSFTLLTKRLNNIEHLRYAKNIRIFCDQLSIAKGFTVCKIILLKQQRLQTY